MDNFAEIIISFNKIWWAYFQVMGLFSATWLKAEAINCLPINMTGGALPCNLDLSGTES